PISERTVSSQPIRAVPFKGLPFFLCHVCRCSNATQKGIHMAKRKPEPKGASTMRSQKSRARRRLRTLLTSHDAFVALDLQQFFRTRQLPQNCWVPAEEFFGGYAVEHRHILLNRSFAGIESAVVAVNGRLLKVLRPTLLGKGKTNG